MMKKRNERDYRELKICYLANAASTHTVRWINYFAEHGWKVDLITWHPPANKSEINPDVAIHRILFPPHYLARYGALIEISRLIRKIRPDILHAHYISHFGVLAGLYGCLSRFKPIVLTAWGSDILYDARGFKKWLIKYTLNSSNCIHCDAKHMMEALIKLGVDSKKIVVVYFGTDTQKFNPEKRNEMLKIEFGTYKLPVIISLRNFEPEYDIKSLVKSIPIVLNAVPEAKFEIAGSGSHEAELKELAKSLGVSDSTRFVGWIPNDKLPNHLASADVYVSTSLSDAGLAASTAEAMACELPVVITDFGDNRKWVEDGVNGFIVPLKNPKTLAEKIIYLLENEDVRKEFGKRNRKIIEEKNNYYKEMEKMENIYIELIEKFKP